jgi:two-component system, OmpR family, alkaline phosphatase synthesis response regulator PhoP
MEPAEPRVLLVDDDPVILRLLEVNFRLDGFKVAVASRGDDAIAAVDRDPPDAVIVDVMMPGVDGYGVCERLRLDPRFGNLPIVMLTARSQEEDLDRGTALGIAGYMTKPFDPSELVALVRSLLQGPS